mmetsp:Transcript_46721/g.70565  ORF Transcript_46721/g.70565 Transcript_46721/m.70565 type:complete len:137 (-) Transcript_46721:457-867(-)
MRLMEKEEKRMHHDTRALIDRTSRSSSNSLEYHQYGEAVPYRKLASTEKEKTIFGGVLIALSVFAALCVLYLLYKKWKRRTDPARMEGHASGAAVSSLDDDDGALGDIAMDRMGGAAAAGKNDEEVDDFENENDLI